MAGADGEHTHHARLGRHLPGGGQPTPAVGGVQGPAQHQVGGLTNRRTKVAQVARLIDKELGQPRAGVGVFVGLRAGIHN